MNIVQAYTKIKGQCIILISGYSGSGKTKIAKFLSELFKFQYIDQSQFYYPKDIYDQDKNYFMLKDGTKVLYWDNIYDSVDWDKFNNFINSNKNKGLIITGFGFPDKLLQFEPDFHIQIKINKQNLFAKMEKYNEKSESIDQNIDQNTDQNIDINMDKNIFNSMTYPMQQKINSESKINKFINTNEISEEKVKEEIFNYLMDMIDKWLQHNSSNIYPSQNDESAIINTCMNTRDKNIQKQNKIKNKAKVHYEGDADIYDEFYYPDKKRRLYDFNDEGIEYPNEYSKKFNINDDNESSSLSTIDSDNDDAIYLFTRDGRELIDF